TVSAAEDCVYNLKMLHRATQVGETTQGSAHAGVFHRIDDHFGMGIPEVKVVNPYGNVWSAAGLQGEVWSRRQVCANVFGLWWRSALLAMMSCARVCPSKSVGR